MNSKLLSVKGCLLGGAIGDALGYPVEFLRWSDIKRRYGEEAFRAMKWISSKGWR